ncbi:MAG: AEC family transporter [Alphaproteobacteria bacterium]|nr:AEC family transporter [Alphaproteobacteria bacterium]
MATILASLIPVFLLIALGLGLRTSRFVPDLVWPPIEKLTYFIFFPALLFQNCRRAPLEGALPLALSMGLGVLGVAVLALALRPLLKHGPAFSSVFQGTIRPNTYVGLAAAATLYGQSGSALTAVCVAVVVPLVNLFSVGAVLIYGEGDKPKGFIPFLKPVIANPLINACLLGLLLNKLALPLPLALDRFLDILTGASLPMGLLAVGAGIHFQALFKTGIEVLVSSLLKLLALPLLTFLLLKAFGLGGEALAVGFLYATLPCSASSYVLARQMGGDAPLMANIISVQTILAMVSMPLLLIFFGFSP